MSILFLDIDGVLNSHRFARTWKGRGFLGMDPASFPLLGEILEKTGCDIVISSTWRIAYDTIEDLRKGFTEEHGFPFSDKIVSMTPRLWSGFRGDEVSEWRRLNRDRQKEPYVCIDDNGDFYRHQPLVQTSEDVGITPFDVKRCIALLPLSCAA